MKLSEEIMEKIEKFANSIDTSFYASRNQFDNNKRLDDQITGKMGEFCTFLYLKDKYKDLTEPDLNLYSKKEKSWDFDLKAENINLHVKAQTTESGNRYGISWLFQKQDKHIFNFEVANQYVSFVSVDIPTRECEIRSILPLHILHEQNLFKLPKLKQLQNSKCAIYYEDLKPFAGECL